MKNLTFFKDFLNTHVYTYMNTVDQEIIYINFYLTYGSMELWMLAALFVTRVFLTLCGEMRSVVTEEGSA